MKFLKWLKETITENTGIVVLGFVLAAFCVLAFNVLLHVQ